MGERYQSYPEYMDSRFQWLGKLPTHWKLIKAKYLFNRVQRGLRPDDSIITAFRDGQVTLRSNRRTDGFTNSVKEIGYQGVRKGDLLVHAMDGFAGAIGVSDSDGKCSPVCSVCVPTKLSQTHLPYYGYLVRQLAVTDFITSLAKGIRERSTEFRFNEFAVLDLAVPSLEEQQTIANFLDHETVKIDTLIDKQQQLIKLLKEKRQAVISHAVTKGLNPTAPTKDSGVEWLGEVPEHWVVAFLKYFWTVLDCKHITAEFVEDGIPLASIKEVKSWVVDLNEAKKTTESFYELLIDGNRKPQFGDIIYSRNATVGEAALVPENVKFAMGQDVCLLKKLTEFNAEYFLHQLNSPVVKLQLESLLIGSTFKRINVEEIRNYLIVSPPIEEQAEIADYLQTRANRYDQLIEKAETAIALMQERRTALISAAVTGKIDVRNWQPSQTEITVGCGER